MKSRMFYEIELKSLLTREQYETLSKELPQRMRLFNEDVIHTTKYTPGDVRLRHSPKIHEIVCKEADPTKICRKEITIPLNSRHDLFYFAQMFELMGLRPDPPWVKHKQEFKTYRNGYEYVVCLQDIENFGYLLEVEFLSDKDTSKVHEPNLRAIIKSLGCEPINPEEFLQMIMEYIRIN